MGLGSLVSAWLRPHRPNPEKQSPYESGEAPVGSAKALFNTRFYVLGLIFMLFEIETVLLFPWATIWSNRELHEATEGLWTRYMALAGTLFIAILAVGLLYVGVQGDLAWDKPSAPQPAFSSKVPLVKYEQINERYASAQGTR